ncbi:hypothetical protein DFH29DRAFT_1085501 [Suillus ampliporus]|nr:hypothetical protein DFH29DRAFT_1085501 [Suillus ampliporus]
MISVFNGAARATITGYLVVSYFKEAVLDPTRQLMYETKKVSDLGVVAPHFCLSTLILIFASNKAARDFLSDDIKQQPAPLHDPAELNLPFTGDITPNIPASLAFSPSNTIAIEAFDDSPTACSTPRTLLLTSTIQKPKRFSIDSNATLADDDDAIKGSSDDALDDIKDSEWVGDESSFCEADFSGSLLPGTKTVTPDDSDPSQQSEFILADKDQKTSENPDLAVPSSSWPVEALTLTTAHLLGNTPIPSAIPRLKPPDTKHTAIRLPHSKQKYERRTSRLKAARESIARSNIRGHTTMIDHLEHVYDDILYDQAALVDGWADAMAALGLTSMLSPGPSLPNQKTPISRDSASILIQD